MIYIETHLKHDVIIDSETILRGIITGNVTVKNSNEFIVNGIVNGNITIEKDSNVVIYGIVNGNIHNEGYCKIHGIIIGELNGNKFDIDDQALINP